jgi:hypothetical protein
MTHTEHYDQAIRITAMQIWHDRGGDPRFNVPPTLNEILRDREREQIAQLNQPKPATLR